MGFSGLGEEFEVMTILPSGLRPRYVNSKSTAKRKRSPVGEKGLGPETPISLK